MKTLAKICAAALMLGGCVIATEPASAAGIDLSIGIGGPGWSGDYDFYRPCPWYRDYDVPVPRRCYRYFYGIWGSGLYVDGDFIFRDRDHWNRWRDRDDYRHWRNHDFHWHGGGHDGGHGGHDWGHDGGHGGHDGGHPGGGHPGGGHPGGGHPGGGHDGGHGHDDHHH